MTIPGAKQLRALGRIVGLTVFFTVVLVFFGHVVDAPPENSLRLAQAEMCLDDGSCQDVTLPIVLPAPADESEIRARVRFIVPPTAFESPQAIYVPDYADALGVRIERWIITELAEGPPEKINRNRPALFVVPPGTLGPRSVPLDIEVAAHPVEGLRLGPVWVGPEAALAEKHAVRFWITASLPQAIFLTLCGLSIAFIYLAWARRKTMYAWQSLATVSAAVFTSFFVISEPPLPITIWTWIWESAIRLYGFSTAIFLLGLVQVRALWFVIGNGVFTACCILALALAPTHRFTEVSELTHIISIIPALIFVVLFITNRNKLQASNTHALTALFALMIASGVSQLFTDSASAFGTVVSQSMPLLMLGLGSWTIMNQLVVTLHDYETLTDNLQARVDAKSQELEAIYAELAEQRRVEALSEERERIMMDLHDGVGGQLVTALAYLEGGGEDPALLRSTLNACLADLSLTVDSLAAEGSIPTLLGMLRSRLLPVFEARGVQLDWEVAAAPDLPEMSASNGLHVLRIVQEALTNTLKHAGATSVKVRIDAHMIDICDNGRGLSASPRPGGVGLRGMMRRAEAIKARIAVEDTGQGTHIRLAWDTANSP